MLGQESHDQGLSSTQKLFSEWGWGGQEWSGVLGEEWTLERVTKEIKRQAIPAC